jgi:hypothetical protein
VTGVIRRRTRRRRAKAAGQERIPHRVFGRREEDDPKSITIPTKFRLRMQNKSVFDRF